MSFTSDHGDKCKRDLGKMNLALAITHSTLCVINIIIHSIGAFLMDAIKKQHKNSTQATLIKHLSISELMWSLVDFTESIFVSVKGDEAKDKLLMKYLGIVELCGIFIVYITLMVYITLDRFFHFYYATRYTTIFSIKRASKFCKLAWVFSAIICATVAVAYKVNGEFDYEEFIFSYVFPVLELVFLATAAVTYSYIYYIFKRQKKISGANLRRQNSVKSENRNQNDPRRPKPQKARKPKLYIPSLIILTFLIFIVVPDIVYLVVDKKDKNIDFAITIRLMYMTCLMSDAVIYIFLQRHVRKELKRRLRKALNINDNQEERPRSQHSDVPGVAVISK